MPEELLTDFQSEEDRKAIAVLIMNLFKRWELSQTDQLNLLGLNPGNKTALLRYKQEGALKNSHDLLHRTTLLLSIHSSLGTLYPTPESRDMKYSWIREPNGILKGKIPLEIMKTDGIIGINLVDGVLQAVCNR